MTSFLDSASSRTIAFCWRLERRDGVCLGFTSHDRDLDDRRAASIGRRRGCCPRRSACRTASTPTTLDVAGALTSDAISEADLARRAVGRGGGRRCSWSTGRRPDGERLPLARGELGDVAVRATASRPSCAGPAALLDAAGGRADLARMPGRAGRQEVPGRHGRRGCG